MADQQFLSFSLNKIFPEIPLPGDLYLFINGKFLKLKNAGDILDNKKYELFLLKKIQFVFISENDRDNYLKWAEQLSQQEKSQLVKATGEENIEIVEDHLQMKGEILSFVTKEVTEASVKEVLFKTRQFVEKAQEKKLGDKFLAQLMSYGQSAADHSTNVANLSTYLAFNIGFSGAEQLENIYLGALLHDYGKTRINPKYLEDPNSDVYQKAMRKHPSLGKTALLLDSGFPEPVLRIISEHHERHDGRGYPKGLSGGRIYELSIVVAIANLFDNIVMQESGDIQSRQRKAYKLLEKDMNHMFDRKILSECLEAMNKVF